MGRGHHLEDPATSNYIPLGTQQYHKNHYYMTQKPVQPTNDIKPHHHSTHIPCHRGVC